MDNKFLTLPFQCITVKLSEIELTGNVDWTRVVREGRGRGHVTRGNDNKSPGVIMELFVKRFPIVRQTEDHEVTMKIRDFILSQIRIK